MAHKRARGSVRTYQNLDAFLVVGVVFFVAAIIGYMCRFEVPERNLPIVAGALSSLISGVIIGYATFRWGYAVGRNGALEPAVPGHVRLAATVEGEATAAPAAPEEGEAN